MAEISNESQRANPENLTDEQLKEHLAKIDAKCKSPEQRASEMFEYLKKGGFTTWDAICFCANFTAAMCAIWPWLEEPAKWLSSRVYRAHYFFNDKVLDEEGKL